MDLGVFGITCKYINMCTDSKSTKCFNCGNNTHPKKSSKGSYYIDDSKNNKDDEIELIGGDIIV